MLVIASRRYVHFSLVSIGTAWLLLVVGLSACDDGGSSGGQDGSPDVPDASSDVPDVPEEPGEESDGLDESVDPVDEPPDEPIADPVCDPDDPGVDRCTGDADRAIIEADVDAVNDTAVDCAIGCLGEPDTCECSRSCVAEETELTEQCAGCYAWIIQCSIEHCLSQCIDDASSQPCRECQAEYCYETFDACTGVTE